MKNPAPAGERRVRARILLVDDNVDGVDTLAELLSMSGYEVQVAYDGASGLERFFTFAPDVAILDLGLPRIDGFRLAQMVRTDSLHSATPLIALSAYDADHHRERSRRAGFDHHLAKPVDIETLQALLRDYDR